MRKTDQLVLRKQRFWKSKATGGSTTTLIDSTIAGDYADDVFNGDIIRTLSGTGLGQNLIVTDFTGSTGTFTFATATAVASGTTYVVIEPASKARSVATTGSVSFKRTATKIGSKRLYKNASTGKQKAGVFNFAGDIPMELSASDCIPLIENLLGHYVFQSDKTKGNTTLTGTFSSGTTTTAVCNDIAGDFDDDHFNDMLIHTIAGTGSNQNLVVTDFVGSTGTFTFATATAPDNTTTFRICKGIADSGGTNTLVDSILTEADSFWIGATLKVWYGTGAGEERTVTDFIASSDTITYDGADLTIDNTSVYDLTLPTRANTHKLRATGIDTELTQIYEKGLFLEVGNATDGTTADSVICTGIDINAPGAGVVDLKFDLLARQDTGGGTSDQPFSPDPVSIVFDTYQISLGAGVTGAEVTQQIESFNVAAKKSGVNPLHNGQFNNPDKDCKAYSKAEKIEVTGKFKVNRANAGYAALLAALEADTAHSILITCTSDQMVTGATPYSAVISLPECSYVNAVPSTDEARIFDEFEFSAGIFTGTDPIICTLVNDKESYAA